MQGTITWYILLFTLPLLSTALLTPFISRIASQNNLVDQPCLHKTHQTAIPLLGGLAIFISFSAILFILLPVDQHLLSLVISTAILVFIGLIDDLNNLHPYLKLSGQVLAAAIVVFLNASLFRFMVDYFANFYLPGEVVLILIIGWIVLMINAFNLIDGLDGLAAGTAAIIFMAMAALSIIEGSRSTILGVQLIGAGACLGFLIYNFNPARIFMGDTGSMLLGFILATSHLYVIKYPFSAQLVLGSMFIFAYPALDICYAIFRRLKNRKSIFKADKGHIHHILCRLGYSVRQTVLIIYGVNICFAILAVLLLSIELPVYLLFILWVITITGTILFFWFLNRISRKMD